MKLLSYSRDYTEIDFQFNGIDYCAEIGVDTNDSHIMVELFKLNVYDIDGTEIQYSNPLFKEMVEVIETLMQELYYEIQVCQAEKM